MLIILIIQDFLMFSRLVVMRDWSYVVMVDIKAPSTPVNKEVFIHRLKRLRGRATFYRFDKTPIKGKNKPRT